MFIVVVEGKLTTRHVEGRSTLADILTDAEYIRFNSGALAAFNANGGLLDLSSTLTEGQTVVLRPLNPETDLVGFGFKINSAGDIVNIKELLAIRKYESDHACSLYLLAISEIRQMLNDSNTVL